MSRTCAGDWMKLRVGEMLQRKDNPRHTAQVEAIFNSATVKLRLRTGGGKGWAEYVTLDQVHNDYHKMTLRNASKPGITHALLRGGQVIARLYTDGSPAWREES